MGESAMERNALGGRALLLFALSCLGCDQVAGSGPAQGMDPSDGTGDSGLILLSRDAGIGTLTPKLVDGGHDAGSLTTVTPPAKDAGSTTADAGQGDAGHDAGVADASDLVLDQDGGSVEPNPTVDNPACKTRFYRDLDGDGFGDATASVVSCTRPLGYVLIAGDCYDNNDRAHPGATGQFLANRGDGSFDYDCDGAETLARTKFAVCPSVVGACAPDAVDCDDSALRVTWDAAEDGGWTDFRIVPCLGALCPTDNTKVPACGQAGYWGLSVAWDVLGAAYACTIPSAGTTRIQTCR